MQRCSCHQHHILSTHAQPATFCPALTAITLQTAFKSLEAQGVTRLGMATLTIAKATATCCYLQLCSLSTFPSHTGLYCTLYHHVMRSSMCRLYCKLCRQVCCHCGHQLVVSRLTSSTAAELAGCAQPSTHEAPPH